MPPKVLVVEDEFFIAMDLRKMLREGGYDVVGPVASVKEALAMLQNSHPDACVLDIGLRDERSTAVAVALRERQVPFLLSTAYKLDQLARSDVFEGVTNIGKPADKDELLSTLASLLSRS